MSPYNADPSLPRAQPRLNFDILRLVCDYVTDVPDVLSFGLTCSALTEDALRRRLMMAPVHLSKPELVDSLYNFIFSNQPPRALWIYGLKIRTVSDHDLRNTKKSDFEATSNRLVAIVKAAPRIQYLDIKTSVSDSVFDAAVKLTTVRELHIFNDVPTYEEHFLEGLAAFHSPLRSLHVAGSDLAGSTLPASFLHDRLSHLAPTLESLDLDDFLIDISPSSVTTQFTAVRSLKLQASLDPDRDLLGVLVRLFPKLDRTLELGPLDGYIMGDDVPIFRERCQEAQQRNSWLGLDCLVCDAETAYLLALRCPIRRMHIAVDYPAASPLLAEVMHHHCPPHLHLHISLLNGFAPLDGLFPPEAEAACLGLTHLVVFVDIQIRHGRRSSRRNRGDSLHSYRVVNKLLGSIQHLRVTYLRVVFHYSIYVWAAKTTPHADSAGPVWDVMNLEVPKARFVDAIPTLQYLFLTSCGQTHAVPPRKGWLEYRTKTVNKWVASKAWRIIRNIEDTYLGSTDASPAAQCVELSGEVEDRIAREEELQLSREEEVLYYCLSPPENYGS